MTARFMGIQLVLRITLNGLGSFVLRSVPVSESLINRR